MITIHSILFSLLIISSLQDNVVELVGIEFKVVKKGHSDRKYIWLHGDEQTARMALESHMKLNLGTAFFIQGETREKDFFDGILDPNRIFSSKGAEANIHKYNRSCLALENKKHWNGSIEKGMRFWKVFFQKMEGYWWPSITISRATM